jgi:hypothetical protein
MSKVRNVRLIAVLLVAALMAVVAGCGGNASVGGAADVVPADVAVVASVDTDLDGAQWQTVEDLAARFPGGEGAVEKLFASIGAEDDLDFERDVKPALGPQLVLVVPKLSTSGDQSVVALMQPADPAAFERLVAKSDEPVATTEVDGWQAVASDQATLDAFLDARDGPRLSDSDAYAKATSGLETDALVHLYVNGEALAAAEGAAPGPFGALLPGGQAPAIGATLRAEDDGVRVEGRIVSADGSAGALAAEPYEAMLPERVPADVLAFVSFHDLASALSRYADAASQAQPDAAGAMQGLLGGALLDELGPLFSGESALYVSSGKGMPEATLVTEVDDERQAVDTVDGLVEGLGGLMGLGQPRRHEVAGVEARTVRVSPDLSLTYSAFGGLLVVSTSPQGIETLRGDHGSLADSAHFQQALSEAGLPDATTGFGYVDLRSALQLLMVGPLSSGESAEASKRLAPLGSIVFWGTPDDDGQSFSLFVGIQKP